MWLEVVLTAGAVACLRFLLKKNSEPLHGVHSPQSGAWFLVKKWLAVIVLTVLRRRSRLVTWKEAAKSPNKSCSDPGFGVKSELLERSQQLTDDENAVDCMYFNGLDSSGSYVIFRIARRYRRMAEISLSVNIPGIGSFQSPIHPDTSVYNVDCSDSFSAAGIKFECLEPMKRWKITYNGLMRRKINNECPPEPFETVHIQLSLTWCAFTNPFHLDTDIHPDCISTAVAREKWSRDFLRQLNEPQRTHCYDQWGELWGSFQLEAQPEILLRGLRGRRNHMYGEINWRSLRQCAVCSAYLEDGTVIQLYDVNVPGTLSLLQCGYLTLPNAVVLPISWTDMDLSQFGENRIPPSELEFNFKAGGRLRAVKVTLKTSLHYYIHEDWRSVVHEQISSYEVDGVKGHGVFQFLYRHSGGCPLTRVESLPLLCEPTCIESGDNEALALTFSRPGCSSSKLIGGKGCQLALLTQLNSQEFLVPNGFCLTVNAFEAHVKSNPKIQQAIDELSSVSRMNPDGLQSTCLVVVEHFKTSQLCTVVNNSLVGHLVRVFGDDYSNTSLAVRSSATGEDGTEMSAAGQMDTVLGAKGLQQICEAICNCWASTFAFAAVSYRRQYGQPINVSAGVVIQEMAPAAAAGVLFTRHPATGNPGVMALNANYGLGESVVSGQCEPDEILISRSWDDKLTILNKTLGHKKLQIRLKNTGCGVEEVNISDTDAATGRYCLSDAVALKLAGIGVELEKRFGNPRDIEFAIDKTDKIYLLQARPITTVGRESDFHLLHEFDTPICTDDEWFTTANVQEMMPGAMTPLTVSAFTNAVEEAGQLSYGLFDERQFVDKYFPVYFNQPLISIQPLMWTCNPYTLTGDKQMIELSLLGEPLEGLSTERLRAYHGYPSLWKIIKHELMILPTCRAAFKERPVWTARLKDFTIADRHHGSATELYDDITSQLAIFNKILVYHFTLTNASAILNGVLTGLIAKNQKAWNNQHISDVAVLLSKCTNVCSADVPAVIERLAQTLRDSGAAPDFAQLSPEDAVEWLKSTASGSAGDAFEEFLKQHGHRCVREAEFREKSWRTEPSKIVTVLQTLVKGAQWQVTDRNARRTTTADDIKTQLTAVGRLILNWLVPKVRYAVGCRELAKSQSIYVTEVFKQAYRKLAVLMVNEDRLPDTDLIYFFTHREIGQLLKTRSGRMIAKGQRRRQLLPKQMSAQFPRVFAGHPQQLEDAVETNGVFDDTNSTLKLAGMPVSHGVVRGKARVVTSLESATEIQAGEILIVQYTDVGWSPYFPMISGLVTEIGSLLSHGAVVARECGIPCVVAVSRATKLFKTGDMVLLNGTAGTLEKLNGTVNNADTDD